MTTIFLQPFYNLLMALVDVMPANSLALAVILLTLAIRLILLPTTKTMARQQGLIAKLRPEIDKIQKKYKDNKAKQSQAVMAFYKKHHINPLGSCFPLIIQLVIFLILYNVFRIGVNVDRFDLLYSFTPRPPEVNADFFGIDLSHPELWILPFVTAALQFVQSYQMMPKGKQASDDPGVNIQKQMTYIFPVVTFVIARSMPAALPLYWSVSSLFSVIQQHFVIRQIRDISTKEADEILEKSALPSDEVVEEVIEEHEKPRAEKKKGGVSVTVRQKGNKK